MSATGFSSISFSLESSTYMTWIASESSPLSLSCRRENGLLSDAIHVIYVELSKLKGILKKPVADMTDLEKWALFLRYADIRKYRDRVNEVIESKEAMQMAGNLLMSVSQDERERAVFRSRRMYQTDMQSNWNTAFDNGLMRGREEGRLEGREESRLEGAKGSRIMSSSSLPWAL